MGMSGELEVHAVQGRLADLHGLVGQQHHRVGGVPAGTSTVSTGRPDRVAHAVVHAVVHAVGARMSASSVAVRSHSSRWISSPRPGSGQSSGSASLTE